MYYYGNNGYAAGYSGVPACGMPYAGYSTGGSGAAIWIVLFILLVIILGAGSFRDHGCCNR